MKKTKLLLCSLLMLCLSFVATGCSGKSEEDVQKEFDEYLVSLPARIIENDNLNLEYTFKDATAYGFTDEILNLPYSNQDDYDKMKTDTEEMLSELDEMSYDKLTDEQKLTFDILKDNLERTLLTADFYDLDNSYLGSFVSFQAQLPLLLNEFTFERQHDLDSYFNVLQTSGEVFQKYYEIEKDHQDKGTGMSKVILDKTIEQCKNFTNTEHLFLIDTINAKIDAVAFLDDTQKADAKKKNEDLLVNSLIPAYQALGDNLATISPAGADLGLSSKPQGKEYYEALLKQKTGLDMGVEEVRKYLEDKNVAVSLQAMQFFNEHEGITDNLDFSTLRYSDYTSVEETMDYLSTKIFEDFPKVDQLNYKINTVDESMKDNFSPAAYLQGKIDAPLSEEEAIYINGDFTQTLFPTIAHEGYPGHMYQHVYFKSKQLPTIRYLLDYNGYSEGWATYIEKYATKYATVDDKVMLELYDINQALTKVNIALMDIGVNYDGWDRATFKAEIQKLFGDGLSDEDIDEQYNLFVETPTNYLQYYLNGFMFEDLQERAESSLGDKYDAAAFHDVILSTGPAPFAIIEKQVDKYIEANK